MEEKEKQPIWKRILLKLTSFKNIVAIWAMVMLTNIVFTGKVEFADMGWGLLGLIGGDVIANIVQKKLTK